MFKKILIGISLFISGTSVVLDAAERKNTFANEKLYNISNNFNEQNYGQLYEGFQVMEESFPRFMQEELVQAYKKEHPGQSFILNDITVSPQALGNAINKAHHHIDEKLSENKLPRLFAQTLDHTLKDDMDMNKKVIPLYKYITRHYSHDSTMQDNIKQQLITYPIPSDSDNRNLTINLICDLLYVGQNNIHDMIKSEIDKTVVPTTIYPELASKQLVQAIAKNNVTAFNILTSLGVNVVDGNINQTKVHFDTDHDIPLLLYAIMHDSVAIARELIKVGADVNQGVTPTTNNINAKITPLCMATLMNNYEMVKLLIDNGAAFSKENQGTINTNPHVDDRINNPILLAISNDAIKIVKLFLKNGVPYAQSYSNGLTLLHYAAQFNAYKTASFLVKTNNNENYINRCNNTNHTPLHYAASLNAYETAQILLSYDANIEATTILLNTPLMLCAQYDADKVMALLLAAGANVQAQNLFGNTALHHAVRYLANKVIPLLLAAGANINIRDISGDNVLELAALATAPTDEARAKKQKILDLLHAEIVAQRQETVVEPQATIIQPQNNQWISAQQRLTFILVAGIIYALSTPRHR